MAWLQLHRLKVRKAEEEAVMTIERRAASRADAARADAARAAALAMVADQGIASTTHTCARSSRAASDARGICRYGVARCMCWRPKLLAVGRRRNVWRKIQLLDAEVQARCRAVLLLLVLVVTAAMVAELARRRNGSHNEPRRCANTQAIWEQKAQVFKQTGHIGRFESRTTY